MRLFRIKTEADTECILSAFEEFYEHEKHTVLDPLKLRNTYFSDRVGIHCYINENRVHGYYETGERNRHGYLFQSKEWFFIRMKRKGGKSVLYGLITGDFMGEFFEYAVILTVMLSYFRMPTEENFAAMVIFIIVVTLFLGFTVIHQMKLYNELLNIVKRVEKMQ